MSANNTPLTVTILGSGTCVPSLKRSSCAVLMEMGPTKLLFDSGPGTMRRLLEAETTIFDIAYVFYSHLHPDHTGELVPLLFSTKYPDENLRRTPLTVVAGRGFSDFFLGLKRVYGPWIELGEGLLQIVELDNQTEDSRQFKNFTVKSAPVEHSPESIAYRVVAPGGQSAVYSGDTDYSENLIGLAKDADLLICESALPDKYRVKGHLTPSLAGQIANRAGVGQLVLTHFYPQCDKEDIEKECRATYAGPLALAEDLMRIEVGHRSRIIKHEIKNSDEKR
ncbi:MAG: MBL fold metallo-hydrolase [Desulfobacterales bacterium]|nr:MAG: MBL fold metallo-hydrolase [Desulfobacterales bacterium]